MPFTLQYVKPDPEKLRRSWIDGADVDYVGLPGFSGYFLRIEGGDWSNVQVISGRQFKDRYVVMQGRLVPKGGQGRVRFHLRTDREGVHRVRASRGYLVLLATQGPPPRPGMQALHCNDVAVDDRPSNLRWGSHQDNVADAITHDYKTTPEAAEAWQQFVASRRRPEAVAA